MGPVRGAGTLVERERFAVGVQPAWARGGVLGEEADQIAARPLGAEVASAPVAELRRVDLEQLDAGRAGNLARAIA